MFTNRAIFTFAFVAASVNLYAQEITLVTSDDKELKVPLTLAKRFATLNELINQTDVHQPLDITPELAQFTSIPLTYTLLSTVFQALEKSLAFPPTEPQELLVGKSVAAISTLLESTHTTSLADLCIFLRLVNYLDNEQLLDIFAYLIASKLDKRTPHTSAGIAQALVAYHVPPELYGTILTYYNLYGLDIPFGSNGQVVTEPITLQAQYEADSVGIQTTGKIVVAATLEPATFTDDDLDQAVLLRYNTDGSIDSTFGTQGQVMIPLFAPEALSYSKDLNLVILPNDKILVAGSVFITEPATIRGGYYQFALARYNADGTSDTSFGIQGFVTHQHLIARSSGKAQAITVTPQGTIFVVGYILLNHEVQGALTRYKADGTHDGRIIIPRFLTDFERAEAVAVQPDGKIVVACTLWQNKKISGAHTALIRYNADGSVDTTFGKHGKVIVPSFNPASTDKVTELVIRPDGKIILGGYTRTLDNHNERFALAQYNADGTFDITFGAHGQVLTVPFIDSTAPVSHDAADALVLQPDGRIILAGRSISHGISRMALARYMPDGKLDTTFGPNGHLIVPHFVIGISSDRAYSLALKDNKLIIAGSTTSNKRTHSALARYIID